MVYTKLRITFFFLLLLLGVGCLLAADEEKLVQQITVHNAQNQEMHLYWYNQSNQKTLELSKLLTGQQTWVNSTHQEWIYNNRQQCVEHYYKIWLHEAWSPLRHTTHTYWGDTLIAETIMYAANAANELLPYERKTYTYDDHQQLKTLSIYTYTSNQWTSRLTTTYVRDSLTHQPLEILQVAHTPQVTTYKTTLTYADAAHRMPLTQLLQQRVADDQWENLVHYTTYYDADNQHPIKQTVQQWLDTEGGYAWVNYQNTLYAYEGDLLVSEIYQSWSQQFWKNHLCYTYTYTDEATVAKRTTQLSIYNKWRDISSLHYSYQTAPRREIITSSYDFWGGDTDAPMQSYIPFVFNHSDDVQAKVGEKIEVLYRQESTPVPNISLPVVCLNIHPNPSSGVYYVDTQQHTILSWEVISLSGMVVDRQYPTALSGVIDITHQPKGIYLLHVQTTQGQFVQKLLKN